MQISNHCFQGEHTLDIAFIKNSNFLILFFIKNAILFRVFNKI